LLYFAYPALALLAPNLGQVSPAVVLRPLAASLLAGAAAFALWRLCLGSWSKAAVATTACGIAFFAYGHVYFYLKDVLELPASVVRHRYLIVAVGAALMLAIWGITRLRGDLSKLDGALAIAGLVLLATPTSQMARYALDELRPVGDPETAGGAKLALTDGDPPPDIYYIILDTYTRQDTLLKEYGYDNSDFVQGLEALGFYVPACSRSNYSRTFESLLTSLNMAYLEPLAEEAPTRAELGKLLSHSAVRTLLEGVGYRTVAFKTGYQWSELEDAAVYLSPGDSGIFEALDPFEFLFLRTTALSFVLDYRHQLALTAGGEELRGGALFEHAEFVQRERFILDSLPAVARLAGPKFVFAHILVPHVPRVFAPDGSILTDPRFYAGKNDGATSQEFDLRGYLYGVEFISGRVLGIVREILAVSARPPIIVIQGDTGRGGADAFEILNAYYTAGEAEPGLYPTITPVNTFRVLFDSKFGTAFGLLPDESITPGGEKVPERWPGCVGE
jgi:hypothetical protein